MIRVLSLIVAMSLCLVAFSPLHTQAQSDRSKGGIRRNEAAIPSQYIVVLKAGIDSAQVSSVSQALAQQHGSSPQFIYSHVVKGFSARLNEAAALALARNPMVEYVEEDALVEGAAIQLNAPWGLDRIDQRDLPLNSSYSYANSGEGVNVYLIDSGIRFSHQEFSGRAVPAQDFVADGQNGNDCYGHGTHVAAIIAGNTFGVAKAARLHSVRVLDCANRGTLARIVAAVDWVTANHVKPAVANLSFISTTASDTLDTAVRNSIATGVTYVVSAGNNNIDAGTRSPSRVTEAITVAATDQMDNRAVFSNYGSAVDVFAPGVDINSAWVTDDAATSLRSGTSSAAGFVTGMAARYLSANPNETPAEVSHAITSNATVGKVVNAGLGSPNLLLYRPNSKLAFSTKRDGNYEIYSMNADGSMQTNLTRIGPNWDEYPDWSPDGKKIAFAGDRDNAYYQIYVMNSDGSGVTRLTHTLGVADNWEPVWSPDGKKIAFVSNRDGNEEIYVMNADGTNPVRLTNNTSWDLEPAWSPDGTRLAFITNRDYVNDLEVYVMNADGTNQQNITNNFQLATQSAHNDYYPAWSPDGSKIVFVYDGEGTDEIYVMNADGSGRTNLSHSPGSWEYEPAWSPDGSKIVFESNKDGNYEIYVMNADGSNQTRLTFNLGDGVDPKTANDYSPVWQPL
jgi:Tol biopolymer transport system component